MTRTYKPRNKFRDATGKQLIESWLRIYNEVLKPLGMMAVLVDQHNGLFPTDEGADLRTKAGVSKAKGMPINQLKKLVARCERTLRDLR